MNDREVTKEYWLRKIINKECTILEASEGLGLSTRQVKRLKKGYIEKGVESVIHGNLNRKPKHAISEELKKKVITLKQSDKYIKANIAHFTDLVKEDELKNVKIEYTTIFKILKSNNIKSPKKHRKVKQHNRRKRLDSFGKMLQIDASPHDWFGDGKRYNIHGAIDDATGKIVGLYMTKNECLEGYYGMMERILKKYGRPVSLYSDRHLILHPQNKLTVLEQLEGKKEEGKTHFYESMKELNINMIRAYSPQAKGRIERLWQTLQSRLPVEFEINNINTIEKANKFLEKYINKYNKKFGIEDKNIKNIFSKLPEGKDIKYILCRKETRKLHRGGIISIANKTFKVCTINIPVESTVKVLISKKIGIMVEYKGKYYKTEYIEDNGNKEQYDIMSLILNKMVLNSLKEEIKV